MTLRQAALAAGTLIALGGTANAQLGGAGGRTIGGVGDLIGIPCSERQGQELFNAGTLGPRRACVSVQNDESDCSIGVELLDENGGGIGVMFVPPRRSSTLCGGSVARVIATPTGPGGSASYHFRVDETDAKR